MTASLSSGRVIMTEFIETYKNSECLWKVSDKNYKSKQKRQKALEELLPILKKIDSTANLDSVTKKINSMRSAYNKEHNKVKAASRSGIGAEDEYIPKLWYYDLLLFLNERETEVGSSCDINAILNEENDENKDQDMEMNTDQASPLSPRSEPPPRLDSNNSKKKEKNRVCEVLSKISKRLDSSTIKTKPTFSAFGEHVAEKLRTMNSDAAKYCQKIINDAIFYAEFNNLNYTSRIVTDHIHLDRSSSSSAQSQSPYLERPSRSPSSRTSSPYYRCLRSPSTQPQSPYQSSNQQLDRPLRPPSSQAQLSYQSPNQQLNRLYRPPSTQTQSPYQSPNEQLGRPYRPPSTQTQLPCQAPNELLDRPLRPLSTQTQSPYQSPNEQLNRPCGPPSTQTQSPYQSPNEQLNRPCGPPSTQTLSSYQSPNEQLNRHYRPPSTRTQSPNEQLDRPLRTPSTQTQSPYQSPNEQLDRLYRPPSTQTQSPYQSPNEQLDRPLRPPSTQTQLPYHSPNEQLARALQSPVAQTELLESIRIELPYLDQQDYVNTLSSPIVAEGNFNSMKNYLIFKPRAGN